MKIQKFKKRIGLIGFGCVGQGLYDVVQANQHLGWEVARICVKDKAKERKLPVSAFTYEVQDVLQDEALDVLAELISDPVESLNILRQALQQGKTIVSASKKVIAENLPELIRLQQCHGGVLLYEASVCGSIPILRTLEAYYGAEPLQKVRGVINGSSNYILSRLHEDRGSFGDALAQAQALGFAEADPSLDVDGTDALHKLCVIAAHAYGALAHPGEVLYFGINHIKPETVELAEAIGARIKLVGSLEAGEHGKVFPVVLPTLVPVTDALYGIEDEFNGIEIEAQFAGKQFLHGRGAGSHPTGSAVWADITAAARGYRYTYPKLCNSRSNATLKEEAVALLWQGEPDVLDALIEHIKPKVLYRFPNKSQVIVETKLPHILKEQQTLKNQQVFVALLPNDKLFANLKSAVSQGEEVSAC